MRKTLSLFVAIWIAESLFAADALIKQIRTGEVSPRLLVKTRLRTLGLFDNHQNRG